MSDSPVNNEFVNELYLMAYKYDMDNDELFWSLVASLKILSYEASVRDEHFKEVMMSAFDECKLKETSSVQ